MQALAPGGLEVNGAPVEVNSLIEMKSGDKLTPIPGHPEKVTLQLAFAKTRNSVDRVTLSRTPAAR